MDDTYVVINLLYESEEKVNNIFNILRKHPYINIYKSLHWENKKEILKFLKKNKIIIKNKKLLLGEYAIWVTYIKCFRKLLKLDKKYKYFIVLEDDVIIPNNFLELIYKYYISNNYINIFGSIKLGNYLVGSIYNRSKLEKILFYLENHPIRFPIDLQLMYNDLLNEPSIKLVDYIKEIKSERIKSKKVKNFFNYSKKKEK